MRLFHRARKSPGASGSSGGQPSRLRVSIATVVASAFVLTSLVVTNGASASESAGGGHAHDASSSAMVMPDPGAFSPNLDPGESVTVSEIPPLNPSTFPQAANVGFHEFQANCSVNRVAPDDPIVYPGQPGKSHSHTFTGGATDAFTTTGSLTAGSTSCTTPGDHSSYWFPTMYNGDKEILPKGPQIIYYKAGIKDYNSIRPFPKGLRFVLGSPTATADEFKRDSGVTGWACGNSANNWDLPAQCPTGTRLLVRYKAPSCWDGVNLDSPNHKSHMAYPVKGVCPATHPVAVPMLEYKISYPVDGDLSQLRLASGRGYSWHADFFAAWDPPTQQALVTQCINGGGQCNARGYDQHKPDRGTVLDANNQLIPRP